MGVHTYLMEVVYKDREVNLAEDFNFLITGLDSFSTSNHFSIEIKHSRFFDTYGCREFLYNMLIAIREPLFDTPISENVVVGVRMIGEMHSKVVDLMESQGDSIKVLQKFFSKYLKVNVELGYGRAEPSWRGRAFVGELEVKTRGEDRVAASTVIDRSGYVDLYFRPKHNPNYKESYAALITGLIWLLREPVIIQKILTREIENNTDLATQLMILALDRFEGRDLSFTVAAVYGNTCSYTMKELQEKWTSVHQSAINSNATDYMSIFHAAMYFFSRNKPSIKYPASAYRSVSGVVQLSRYDDGMTKKTVRKFLRVCGLDVREIMVTLLRHCRYDLESRIYSEILHA